MLSNPEIAIITVTYNCEQDLLRTFESIRSQKRAIAEYIVVDGGSTDGTLPLIRMNGDIVHQYVSEPDKGIYDAMNKGIALTRAPYLLFLNAGDTLYDEDTLNAIIDELRSSDTDLLYGDVLLAKDNDQWVKRQPRKVGLSYLFVNNLCHQTMIFHRRLFERFGMFDIQEPLLADFKFLLGLTLSGEVTMRHIGRIVCCYPLTGVSSRTSFAFNYVHRSRVIKSLVSWRSYCAYHIYWLVAKPLTVLQGRWSRMVKTRIQ
ncbi:glycosyltransferase family 2 protein [Paenibacillus glycanilyticus]|uniref:glycosyltransferase family 2 protein n=1 Tax=Paenibacillus glycanilyticus TaxID=126569 RepID=UPI003EB9D364